MKRLAFWWRCLRAGAAWLNGLLGAFGSLILILGLLGIPVAVSFAVGAWPTLPIAFLVILAICLAQGAYQLQAINPVLQPQSEPPVVVAPTVVQEMEVIVYGDVNSPLIISDQIVGPDVIGHPPPTITDETEE